MAVGNIPRTPFTIAISSSNFSVFSVPVFVVFVVSLLSDFVVKNLFMLDGTPAQRNNLCLNGIPWVGESIQDASPVDIVLESVVILMSWCYIITVVASPTVSLLWFEFNDSSWRYSWYELWLILDCNQGRLVGRRWWLGSGRRWRNNFRNDELLKCWLVGVASTRHSQWWSSVDTGF